MTINTSTTYMPAVLDINYAKKNFPIPFPTEIVLLLRLRYHSAGQA